MNTPGNNNEYTTQPIQTRPSLDAFRPFGLISRARPVTSKSNPLISVILKKKKSNACRSTETSTDDILLCLAGRVDKLVDFGCISTGRSVYTLNLPVDMQPKSTNLSTRPAKQSNMSSVEVSVLLHALDFFFLRITLMSGLLLLVTGRAQLMSPKGRNASRDGLV